MKILRPYQQAAETTLFKYLFEQKGNPLVIAPVSAGKSLMIAEFIKKLHGYFPRCRVVMLTHIKELLQQNAAELLEQYPDVDMGFYCAGLGQKRLHNDVTFASIQSIHSKILEFNRIPEIIIVDECHLISHKAATQYRKFIDSVLELNPNCKIIGYTGTGFRADTGRLDEGENRLFDEIAYEISMEFMIEQGYWTKPVSPKMAYQMDVSNVRKAGGDFVEKALQEAIDIDEVTQACVKELIEKGAGRKKWLVFTAGIEHAQNVTDALNAAGVSARCVHSKLPAEENTANLEAHKRGEYTALVNVAKLTTGYNDPTIDLLCFMRPTRSPVLYVQMTGRGVRVNYADGYDLTTQEGRLAAIANGDKPDVMIVDFGGIVSALGPVDQVTVKKKYVEVEPSDEVGEAIMKICPSCGVECATSQQYCYECSYCFLKLEAEASSQAIVSMDQEPEWVEVMAMAQNMNRHADNYKTPSMTVTYATRLGAIREWVCFEHWKFEQGNNKRYAYEMAMKWHRARLPDEEIPQTTMDAVNTKYPQPKRILVKKKGKYWNVINYEWGEKEEETHEFYDIPF